MDEQHIKIDFEKPNQGLEKVDRLCQQLIAKKNFSVLCFEEGGEIVAHGKGFDPEFNYPFITIPELKPLANEFDRILVKTDGMTFITYCIKNSLDGDNKTSMNLEQLRSVGKECLNYTGKVQGTKMPANIFVVETSSDSHDNVTHLKSLKCMPGKQKIMVRAFNLNFNTKKVWTNAPLGGIFAGKLFFQKAISAVESNESVSVQDSALIKSQADTPLMTYGFIGLFAVIFGAELFASGSFISPTGPTLVAFGGLSSGLNQEGEYYRLISAAFLHGGYTHLILNCIAFFFGGLVLEVFLGRAWLFSLFILSALGGSFASLLINSPETLSVGASGGIMGLVAASFMISNRLPFGPEKTQIQMRTMYMLIPAVIPIFMQREGVNIDYAAHIGGAVVGFLVAFIIYKSWSKDSHEPGLMKFAKGLAVACGLVTVVAGAQAALKQGVYQKQLDIAVQLAPQGELDEISKMIVENMAEQEKKLNELEDKYPKDPRVYYFKALIKNEKKDFLSASDILNSGLANTEMFKKVFTDNKLEKEMRLFLARTLIEQSKTMEARAAILPICNLVERVDNHWVSGDWLKLACDG